MTRDEEIALKVFGSSDLVHRNSGNTFDRTSLVRRIAAALAAARAEGRAEQREADARIADEYTNFDRTSRVCWEAERIAERIREEK
jgi:hypothetical protein